MNTEVEGAGEKELDKVVAERAGEKKVVLKHCINGIEHLSFLHGPHMSPTDTIPLPFRRVDEIVGNSCRGLFYFDGYSSDFEDKKINAVIVNLTTKELKLLPQPTSPRTFSCDNGLGYDPQSDDYKVMRVRGGGLTAEVYSLRNDSWKEVQGPGRGVMCGHCGIYVAGRSYWKRHEIASYPQGINNYILCFDFSTETFSRLALPPSLNPPMSKLPALPGIDIDMRCEIVDCNGFLGAVGDKNVYDFKPRDAKHIELWVYKPKGGGSWEWERLFSVVLLDVGVPLGSSDGRFLFLEGSRSSCEHSHLMVYDWVKEELREHDVYVKPPENFIVLSYVENTLVLPDATPLINSAQRSSKKASVPKRSSSGMALKRCSRREKKVLKN